MDVSHPAVHPVEAPPPMTDGEAAAAVPRLRMKDIQGMPGTLAGLILRFAQFVFAAVAPCIMATTSDFASATSFRYLVAASCLQSLWSFSLVIVDIYALLVRRSLQNYRLVSFLTVGDGSPTYLRMFCQPSCGMESMLQPVIEHPCRSFSSSSWLLVGMRPFTFSQIRELFVGAIV